MNEYSLSLCGKMYKISAIFAICLLLLGAESTGEESELLLDDDMYEYNELTSTLRLKHVKQVVDDHLAKDFPKIRDCGPDLTQNWYEPDPEDCSCYFVCTGKYYVHRKCSHGLMFDPYSEQCNWPDSVDCGERSRPWTLPVYHGPVQDLHYNNPFFDD